MHEKKTKMRFNGTTWKKPNAITKYTSQLG